MKNDHKDMQARHLAANGKNSEITRHVLNFQQ